MSGIRSYQRSEVAKRPKAGSFTNTIGSESPTVENNGYEKIQVNEENEKDEEEDYDQEEVDEEENETAGGADTGNAAGMAKKKMARLTVAQLASLYRRLDINAGKNHAQVITPCRLLLCVLNSCEFPPLRPCH